LHLQLGHAAPYELDMLQLTAIDNAGRRTLEMRFPTNAVDAAIAELDRLANAGAEVGTSGDIGVENACTRVLRSNLDAVARGDSTAIAEFGNATVRDHRRGLKGEFQSGEVVRVVQELGPVRPEVSVLATRGECLCLALFRFRGKYEIDQLILNELGDDGLIVGTDIYDDLDAAYDELDARYLAGEGAPYKETLGVLFEYIRIMNADDRDAFAQGWGASTVTVDHRPASWAPSQGVEDTLAGPFGLRAEVTEFATRVSEIHRVSDRMMAYTNVTTGVTADGGDIEVVVHAVAQQTADHRPARVELFADLAPCLTRYDELFAELTAKS
jgi:hypothetical protein